MATDKNDPRAICLDVAVDHRLIRLFKDVQPPERQEYSTHTAHIRRRGQVLRAPADEIRVTEQLAGPSTKGGIVVTLQQPRYSHPYEEGIDKVIEDCSTLRALSEVFDAVSLGSLDIRTNVSVVDILPYTPEKPEYLTDQQVTDSFQTCQSTIWDKRPNVVLCAGKVWTGSKDTRKGDVWKVESLGIGQQFRSPRDKGTGLSRAQKRMWIRLNGRLNPVDRVNCFHPSYAVNYKPHISVLRQLLVLSVAEACGTLRGDWKEETWMGAIRSQCPKEMAPRIQDPGSPRSPRTEKAKLQEFTHFKDIFLDHLRQFSASVGDLLESDMSYNDILDKRLGVFGNDMSLVLRKMHQLNLDLKTSLKTALNELGDGLVEHCENIHSDASGSNHEVAAIVKSFALDVLDTMDAEELYLDKASSMFLQLAVDIEGLLGRLLEEENAPVQASVQDDKLSSALRKLGL